jgi:ubiquinone/menaquinone biosynthesis C-methylase UbiE
MAVRLPDPRKLLTSPPKPIDWALDWVWAYVMPIKMLHGQFYAPTAELLDLKPDDDVLDVACGSGQFLAGHAARARSVAGLDKSGPMITVARRRLADRIAAGTAEVVQGDATDLPWPDLRFSAVSCHGSLEWFSDPAAALAQMHRVLRPGGRVVVTLGDDKAEQTVAQQESPWGMGSWTEAGAREALAEAGFSDIVTHRVKAQDDLRFFTAIRA